MEFSNKGYFIFFVGFLVIMYLPELLADVGINISKYYVMFFTLMIIGLLDRDHIYVDKKK